MKPFRTALTLLLCSFTGLCAADGSAAWKTVVDLTTNAPDLVTDSIQDSAGNIYTLSNSGGVDVHLTKVSPDGQFAWFKSYSTNPGSSTDSGIDIALDGDENPIAIMRESVQSRIIIRKFAKANGAVLWTYIEATALQIYEVACDPNGKLVLLHNTDAITQIDNDGAFISRSSDLWASNTISPTRIACQANGDIVICGTSSTNGNAFTVGGVSSAGSAQWLYSITGSTGSASDLMIDPDDGTVYCAGTSGSSRFILFLSPTGQNPIPFPISTFPTHLQQDDSHLYYSGVSGTSTGVGKMNKASFAGVFETTHDLATGNDLNAGVANDEAGNVYVAANSNALPFMKLVRIDANGALSYEKEVQVGSRGSFTAHRVYAAGPGAVLVGSGITSNTAHETVFAGIERFDFSLSAASIPGGNALTGTASYPDGAWLAQEAGACR